MIIEGILCIMRKVRQNIIVFWGLEELKCLERAVIVNTLFHLYQIM